MVGSGVLLECLEDDGVESVVAVGRASAGISHPKLIDVVHADLFDVASRSGDLSDLDACFYCLGVSSVGQNEESYRRITYDLTMAIADAVEAESANLTFCFVSGQGSDSGSRIMWARVKGEAEDALLARSFESYVFRPGFIQPMKGVRSKTALYQVPYTLLSPVTPLLRKLLPNAVTTTVAVGRAMLHVARHGYDERVLETRDINEVGSQ